MNEKSIDCFCVLIKKKKSLYYVITIYEYKYYNDIHNTETLYKFVFHFTFLATKLGLNGMSEEWRRIGNSILSAWYGGDHGLAKDVTRPAIVWNGADKGE